MTIDQEDSIMKKLQILSLGLVLTMLVTTGCSKTALENQSASDQNPPAAGDTVAPGSMADSDATSNTPASQPLDTSAMADDNGSIDEVVYFDFDSDMLDSDDQTRLRFKAKWLQDNPQKHTLLVEGHCDERGTDAYNMALGARRADTVKDYLIDLGVDPNKLNTQSYGEEKPAEMGHNEAAWSKNRRASFVIE
jgi:peptidoglycan-associated lipoprotein